MVWKIVVSLLILLASAAVMGKINRALDINIWEERGAKADTIHAVALMVFGILLFHLAKWCCCD